MKKMFAIALFAPMLLTFAACQGNSDSEQIVAELGFEVAMIRYIGNDEGKAERALEATKAIRFALEEGRVTTVTELTDLVLARVETANPTEQAFLRAAVALALEDLNVVLPTGGLLDDLAKDRVLAYLDAVDRAALAALGA